tara:strand:- start:236 stop:472 length:237 start_codon:yes stop_codon:yes gene_type:complete
MTQIKYNMDDKTLEKTVHHIKRYLNTPKGLALTHKIRGLLLKGGGECGMPKLRSKTKRKVSKRGGNKTKLRRRTRSKR